MKKNKQALLVVSLLFSVFLKAQNPIIQTSYTADPAPMVYNDEVFLYTSHDENNSTWFTMNNWKLFTSKDMVNWTEHASPASYQTFAWASGDAWAMQVIERNGKFYMYCPVINKENNSPAIGVAVSSSPYGPFYDVLGKPLVQTKNYGDIDPTVFIDDDKQAYLNWGNPNNYFVKLNEDMISFEGEIKQTVLSEAGFGKRLNDPKRATNYEEAPWLYKRNNIYYLFWAGGPLPEHLAYSTSSKPTGPWTYGGVLMAPEGKSFTNHPGVIDYKGKTYLFYHNGALEGGSGFTRSVSVDELKFNKDGSITTMKMNAGIQKELSTTNPYLLNQAETIAWSEGITTSESPQVGMFVTATKNNSYIKVKGVDFGKQTAKSLSARLGSIHDGVKIQVRIDDLEGPVVATLDVPKTGGSNRWAISNTQVQKLEGVHDLYFVFLGKEKVDLAFFDYWTFSK